MNLYDFVLKTIQEAGALLVRVREEGFETTAKGGDSRDVVTSADKTVNDFLIAKIKEQFPAHAIYSEEGGGLENSGEYQWVIDPIDGSANFSRGIPHFAICVGLLEHGIPTVGAVYNPATRELFSFEKGKGAFLNGKLIHVSPIAELAEAHVFFHAGRKKELQEWGGESYRRLLGAAKKTSNFASLSLDTCFVAAGRIEASIYGTLSTLLDVAPALGILYEAGGISSDAEGNEPEISHKPRKLFVSNNRAILHAIREIV